MILQQLAEISINLMLGLSIMFGLALLMSFLTSKDTESFFIFLTIFAGFVVWGGLVDLWVLVLCLIILTLIMMTRNKRSGS